MLTFYNISAGIHEIHATFCVDISSDICLSLLLPLQNTYYSCELTIAENSDYEDYEIAFNVCFGENAGTQK